MTRSFDLEPATRFTAGALGQPGQRVFLVQARSPDEFLTLLTEKQQVFVLARELGRVLAMLPEGDEGTPPEPIDYELIEPLEPDWRIGAMSIEFDPERDRIIVLFREFISAEDDEDDEFEDDEDVEDDENNDDMNGAIARIVVTRAQVRGMVAHALESVSKGRPLCDICSQPMNPGEEHHCPGMNGHRKREE